MSADELGRIGDPVVVFSFGRSGTHLLIDVLRRQFDELRSWKYPGERVRNAYVEAEAIAAQCESVSLTRARLRRAARPIFKTHEWPATLEQLTALDPGFARWLGQRAKLIHIVRNPRDAIASWWSLFAGGHDPRSPLAKLALDPFIAQQAQRWRDHLATAGRPRDCLMLRLEDLTATPRDCLTRIAGWIAAEPRWAEPILPAGRASILRTRIDRLVSVRPALTQIVVSDRVKRASRFTWTPDRLAVLDDIAGDAMEAMGYPRPVERPPLVERAASRA